MSYFVHSHSQQKLIFSKYSYSGSGLLGSIIFDLYEKSDT